MTIKDLLMKLKAAFPDAVVETLRKGKDGKVAPDYAVSKEFIDLLRGKIVDVDNDNKQRYELQFPGKQMARARAVLPCHKTLLPERKQSKNFDATGNVFIEGDNLHALKLLEKCYRGRVNVIYIDPPYNTGGDGFVYNDDFSVSQKQYMLDAGIINEDGEKQILEMQNGLRGRFHAGWLAVMYPRLKLARELLADNGVIFISIDDNEMANLKLICDEIYGEENHIASLIVKSNPGGRDYGGIALTHDNILAYAKSNLTALNPISSESGALPYQDSLGNFSTRELRNRNVKFNEKNRPNLYYAFYVNPASPDDNGLYEVSLSPNKGWVEVYPLKSRGIQTVWRWGKEKTAAALNIDVMGHRKRDGNFMIVEKYRNGTQRERSILDGTEYRNEQGTLTLKSLFPKSAVFNYPKSDALIKRVVELGGDKNALVMDFFAGSATTAHAVMQLNADDDGERQFILVQKPEEIDKKSSTEAHRFCTKELKRPATIAEIAKERIRRAGKKIREENPQWQGDDGFRVYTIADSVLYDKADDNPIADTEMADLIKHKKHLTPENFDAILMEAMLQTGTPPDKQLFIGKEKGYPFAICERKCYCVTENLTQAIASQIAKKHGGEFDIFYYLSDTLDARTSYTQIESALRDKGKESQILTFY